MMAADIILDNETVKVVDGSLSVDQSLSVGRLLRIGDGGYLRSSQLTLEPLEGDDFPVHLSSRGLNGVGYIHTDRLFCSEVHGEKGELTQLDLGVRAPIEGGGTEPPGRLSLQNKNGRATIEVDGDNGTLYFDKGSAGTSDGPMMYVYKSRFPDTDYDEPSLWAAEPEVFIPEDQIEKRPGPEVFFDPRLPPDGPVLDGSGSVKPDPVGPVITKSFKADRVAGRIRKIPRFPVFEEDSNSDEPAAEIENPPTKVISHSPRLSDWGLAYNPGRKMVFQGGGEAALTVDLHGKVGVKMDDPRYELHVNGTVAATEPLQALSDKRCMTEISSIEGALETVLNLKGVSYKWIPEELPQSDLPEGRRLGFVAQDVENVLPEVVSRADGDRYLMAPAAVVPVLLEAVKEQQRAIQAQQTALSNMEDRLATLEAEA